jgi:plastocyanin
MLSDCTTRRGRSLAPEHDAAERQAAQANGARFADLNDVICPYDPCPIVSGDTLMWRNESHLTATYARQLAPAVRDLVVDVLVSSDRPEATEESEVEIVAYDDRFEPNTIEAISGGELIVTLTNEGREKHSIRFYVTDGGQALDAGSIGPTVDPGSSATLVLSVPGPGEYVFLDDGDPGTMRGTLVVHEAHGH